MASEKIVSQENEIEAAHRLEKVLVSIDITYEILVYSKAFSAYFENANVKYYKITDVVHKDEAAEFKSYIDSTEAHSESKIFRVKKNTGEYRFNIVKIRSVKHVRDDLKYTDIEFIDIEDTVLINEKTMSDFARMRRLMSITDEWFFTYENKSNIFSIYHYDDVKKKVVYNMDIDKWGESMLSEELVPLEEKKTLMSLISDIKECSQTFTAKLNCAIKSNNKDIIEPIRFTGIMYTCEYETLVIGRILTGGTANHTGLPAKLLDELQYDSLTGVYNKKAITEYAKKKIKEDKYNRTTIVILDVDHFKAVNDTYGHLYGDKVLARVGAKLKDIVGEDGVVGRIGGDEFMVVLSGINDEQLLRGVLRAIRTQVKWEFAEEYSDFLITCSIGAAIYPNNGKDYEELFKKADYCLYIAKEKGRDRYVFFRDELHAESYEASLKNKATAAHSSTREFKELQYISKFMRESFNNFDEAVRDVLEHMRLVYKADNVSIYYGEDMKKVYSLGCEIPEADNARFVFTDEYKAALRDLPYIQLGLVERVEDEMPDFCSEMSRRGIFSTIQCIIGTPDDIRGLLTFNKCKESSQWANYEVDGASIIASYLSMVKK